MENSDTPKARRPLPTPGAAPIQRPSTPVQGSAQRAIEPVSFYGTPTSTKAAPPLPARTKATSSKLTSYVTPASLNHTSPSPPRYDQNPPGYREPELVIEDTVEEEIPSLISQDGPKNTWTNTGWESTSAWNEWGPDPPRTSFDAMDFLTPTRHDVDVPVDGRIDREESNWWNPEERVKWERPGSGMLPPMLADELHNPHHSLFSVNVPSMPSPPSANPPPTASLAGSMTPTPTPTPQPPHSASPMRSSPSFDPVPPSLYPSEEEVRTAVPHPNSYYCPRENGWVILSWKSSNVPPPLASSFSQIQHPLPDLARRKRTGNCLVESEKSWGKGNKTHHFHRYEKAVDSLKLSPPFQEDIWQSKEYLKQRRRGRTIISDTDALLSDKADDSGSDGFEPEGKLLDLYMCCQCGLYCVVSPVIPGIIPRKYLEELIRDKRQNPPLGKSGDVAVAIGIDTFLVAMENKIFKGNNRLIKINSTGFQTKLGWNSNIKKIFNSIGFKENTASGDATLMSPLTDPTVSDPSGAENRKKLLRAWIELSAWLLDFKRGHPASFRDYTGQRIHIQIDSAREMYQTAIGAHPDQIPRGELQDPALSAVRDLHEEWKGLGLTPTTFSADLLTFAYLSQCRCDPAGTPKYFTYLSKIVSMLAETGSCPPQLQELVVMEQSRHRFTLPDVQDAARVLGFSADGDLRVEYDDEIEDEFVENAWRSVIKRSWRDPDSCAETHRSANEALRILAQARGSVRLMTTWETGKNKMNPDQAYNTLEIPKETDDYMLITVFTMRLEETPSQMDKMREALGVIAETRDSERLRQFLGTGLDPGEVIAPTRPDLPRGLNQLGNTCYLNSLLQYFYTIKDLREAVSPMSNLDPKSIEDDKLSDDAINKHRVGGRHVTRREIIRSKKFISQLANLFTSMEYSETAAVTPSIELAKLALVTSRDEEEDEADKGLSDSSNDTEATLVDDGTSTVPASGPSPSLSTSSVLGKRGRGVERQKSVMEVDVEGYVMVTSPPRRSGSPEPVDRTPVKGTTDKDGDVSMQGTLAPEKPAPSPRKKTDVIDSGGMMFGKQHDVAECMDNCMFQIEAALLKFDFKSDGQSGKSSVVKRLFYGKIRQRLTGLVPNSRASIHEKEDLFSHLPVNVINDGVDIYDGLSGYFDDLVDWEGGKARMEVSLVDCPPLLQIQLQRVQFNRETLQPYKSQAYVKFGETIYLDRFMDNADPQKKIRSRLLQRQLNECRERIRILLEGKNGSFMSTLEHTSNFLSTVQASIPGVEDTLVQTLREEQTRVQQEIDELRAVTDQLKEELEDLWKDSKAFPYELTSVFIHRGSSPSWGHYFFYSRHLPDEPDSWFKYNDSDVTVVPKDEVLQDTTGSTANPYLLVFARKGSNVVQTVNRFDPILLDSA